MKVTVTHTKLTEKERERLVSEVTRRMLEIMRKRDNKEKSDSKNPEKKGDCEW